jgi:hypothetical protein
MSTSACLVSRVSRLAARNRHVEHRYVDSGANRSGASPRRTDQHTISSQDDAFLTRPFHGVSDPVGWTQCHG